jgi:hypothetical protein
MGLTTMFFSLMTGSHAATLVLGLAGCLYIAASRTD